MLRAAVLSIVIFASVVVTLPLVDSSAHNNHRPGVSRRSRMNRRHSRAWWRRYRARLRRKRAEQKRLEAVRAEGRRRSSKGSLNEQAASADSHKSSEAPAKVEAVMAPKSPSVPAASLPSGWSRKAGAAGETRFVLGGQNGQLMGEAALTVVASARPVSAILFTAKGQRKTLGGVPVSELRRIVIDRMVASNGWVVNDFQREIGGKPIFIVTAQTAADGRNPQQSWVFFFAEADGRIYSLASKAPADFADRVADEAAQLVASILAAGRAEASLR